MRGQITWLEYVTCRGGSSGLVSQPDVLCGGGEIKFISPPPHKTSGLEALTQDFWWRLFFRKSGPFLNEVCYKYDMQNMLVSRGSGGMPPRKFLKLGVSRLNLVAIIAKWIWSFFQIITYRSLNTQAIVFSVYFITTVSNLFTLWYNYFWRLQKCYKNWGNSLRSCKLKINIYEL